MAEPLSAPGSATVADVSPTLEPVPQPRLLATMKAVTRRFGATLAVGAVDLDINAGEVVALVGDNGAGKTVLMNILCGLDAADSGDVMRRDGTGALVPMPAGAPRAALAAGHALVAPQPELAESLTALENILLGAQSLWRPRLSRRRARRRLAELMQRLNLRVPLDAPVAELAGGDRLRVAILRALYRPVRVIVLDEPATALTAQEAEGLARALKVLAEDGLAVVVTTRRLDETCASADRFVVLHQSRKVADLTADDASKRAVEAILAERPAQRASPTFHTGSRSILELRKVDAETEDGRAAVREVSFEIKSGEIVGVAGIAHNGQEALAAVASGLVRPTRGEMYLFGRRLARFDPAAFTRAGVGRVPRDRRAHGVVPAMSVAENLVIEEAGQAWLHSGGFLKTRTIREHADDMIAAYNLRCPDAGAPVSGLSAETIDMLVLFRMLDRKPRLIVAEQPTRGLPAEAAAEVHRQLDFERRRGSAILLISEDIDELLALSDAIGVIHRGRVSVPYPNGAFDKARLGAMMGGHGSLEQDWAGWGDAA